MRYKPSFLREPDEPATPIKYGIGIEHKPNEFGMIQGPFNNVEESLECLGEENSYILELPSGRKLWRWIDRDSEWEEIIWLQKKI